jgi:hypothetical protein
VVVSGVWSCVIHLPASLRSPGVTRLPRYYGRSDFRPVSVSRRGGSHCFSGLAFQSFRLQPRDGSAGSFHTLLSSRGSPDGSGNRSASPTILPPPGLGFALIPGGSPTHPAESSSLTLRTNRSLPVAPHPSSRKRSYVQLQTASACPERTSTFPTKPPRNRTRRRLLTPTTRAPASQSR